MFDLFAYPLHLVIGESCKEIKEKYPSYPSGTYIINATRIAQEFTMVYCDMTTDGGTYACVFLLEYIPNELLLMFPFGILCDPD